MVFRSQAQMVKALLLKNLSGRQISSLTQMLEDDLRHAFDEGSLHLDLLLPGWYWQDFPTNLDCKLSPITRIIL